MKNDILATLTRLSDTQLVTQLKGFIACERDDVAEIVARLVELDTRDVHLREGYTSLYVYCRDALGLSEWEAYNRIEVARAARRFPLILDLLADGSVHLTAVRRLAPHLTPSNNREVLESARGKTKLQVEEIVARLSPRPDVPSSIRRLPTPAMATSVTLPDPPAMDPPPPTVVPPPPAVRAAVTALSPDRYKLQVTIGGETLEKLRLAKDMLGHAIPSGDDTAILDRALTALLVELAKKRFADTPRPRRSRGRKPGARQPSAAVKREVWVRDLGRCAFVGRGGHRCNERRCVQFHHLDAYALGGKATVERTELRCRRHNDYEGRVIFGKRRRDGGVVREEPAGYRCPPSEPSELVPEQVRLSVAALC